MPKSFNSLLRRITSIITFLVNGDIAKTLTYVGPLPEYRFFEPKRTSRADYDEMFELYRNGDWNYLKVSEQ